MEVVARHILKDFAGAWNLIKMSSVLQFTFDAVDLCVTTTNEKPWTRARKVFKMLEYDAKTSKTANIIRAHCSPENAIQKYQMSSEHSARMPINWPKDSQKYGIYTNEEGMYELLFSSQQQPKTLEDTAAMCCSYRCNNSSQTKWRKNINKPSKTMTIK